MPSVTVTLTTSYQQLSALVRAKLIADGSPIPVHMAGHELNLEADKANADLIYWTRNPVGSNNGGDLAPESSKYFGGNGNLAVESLDVIFLKAVTDGDKCNVDFN